MNQPDSIQKSRPGLRREVLPGSLLRFGFRSPEGQWETTSGAGGVPGGPPRTDCLGGRASRVRAGRAGRIVRGPLLRLRASLIWDAGFPVPEVTGREVELQDCRDQTPFRWMFTAALLENDLVI